MLSNKKTEITYLDKLLEKEKDKLILFKESVSKLGGNIEISDRLIINGTRGLKGGVTIDVYGDARIAMALTILCCFLEEESTILGVESVLKNYPEFFNDLKASGAQIIAL